VEHLRISNFGLGHGRWRLWRRQWRTDYFRPIRSTIVWELDAGPVRPYLCRVCELRSCIDTFELCPRPPLKGPGAFCVLAGSNHHSPQEECPLERKRRLLDPLKAAVAVLTPVGHLGVYDVVRKHFKAHVGSYLVP